MMASSSSHLRPLQREILDAFFARTQRFFLTGGAALSGFYLGHRDTKDLDLFALPDVEIREGAEALVDAASSLGATTVILRQSGDFRRYAVSRGDEQTLVDLVIDRAPQITDDKARFGAIRVDPLREIAANKICALLDRVEARDLVDLQRLLAEGFTLEAVLEDAQAKHAGADPATLAWTLGGWRVAPTAAVPGGSTAEDIDAFREELVRRLAHMALPREPG